MTKRKSKVWPQFKPINKPFLTTLVAVVIILAALASVMAVYTVMYKDKIYPRTTIGTLDFGGKTAEEAASLLNATVATLPEEIPVLLDNEPTKTKLATKDLDITYDTNKTVEALLHVGRAGSLGQDFQHILNSFWGGTQLAAHFGFNEEKVTERVAAISKEAGTQAEDTKIVLDGDVAVLTESKEGFGVSQNQLDTMLRHNLEQLRFELKTTAEKLVPRVTQANAQTALASVKAILAKTPLTLTADDDKTTADTKQVFAWITYSLESATVPTPTATPALPTGDPSPQAWRFWLGLEKARAKEEEILVASLSDTKVKDFIANLAIAVATEPQNAELEAKDGAITVTKRHVDGRQLQLDAAVLAVKRALTEGTDTTALTIALPVETIEAKVKENKIAELGIKELIGRADTSFKGSPANRVHNISTGAGFLDGAIVAPGEEFSTVKTLGAVDGSTGYLPELVIKENRTTPEYGGGLCQVSTTLFRSVLNAGLKVTERTNHSYRVSYYEPPVGLDATIYLPRPDFKFLNDTPGHILMQSRVQGTKITFELYGTKDNRSSTISDPIVSNITDPPEPIYTDTDTLPKGETKQIEKPHQGATAVVTYIVTKDGQEYNKQTFRSRYKAWGARFLVGTRE